MRGGKIWHDHEEDLMRDAKPSLWTRLKWVLVGKPISHAEAEAAKFTPPVDPASLIQLNARGINSGFRH